MAKDLTREQFHAALDRNGFKRPVMFWIESKDDSSTSYGIVTRADGTINRRATLAHIIERRASNRRKGEAAS